MRAAAAFGGNGPGVSAQRYPGAADTARGERTLPRADAGAPLPWGAAKDWRDAVVRGDLVPGVVRGGIEDFRTGPLDRLELSAAVRAVAPAGEQLPILRFARLASSKRCLAHPRSVRATPQRRLARGVRPPNSFARTAHKRPSSIRGGTAARSIAPPTGSRSAPPSATGVARAAIAPRPTRPRQSCCARFPRRPVPYCRQPICRPRMLEECRSSCSRRPKCSPCRSSSARSPIRAAAKAGAIPCTWCSRSPRPQRNR